MNLFLLAAIPLSAVISHRLFHPNRSFRDDYRSWIWGAVWSIVALIVASLFGKWREFGGSLLAAAGGLTFTDAILVPGGVIAAWVLTRRDRDAWDLGLWLALVFTMAGIRDFAATSRTYDLNEYFLVPLDRILLLLTLPTVVVNAVRSQTTPQPVLWIAAGTGLLLTTPLVNVLSWGNWGWLVWILEAGGLAGAVWWNWNKKAAPQGSGLVNNADPITSEERPAQP